MQRGMYVCAKTGRENTQPHEACWEGAGPGCGQRSGEVEEQRCSMRATRFLVLGAASHVCCGQSLYNRDLEIISPPCNGRRVQSHSRPQQERRGAPRSWLLSGGGVEASDDETHTRWWRSRKRWAKRQAEKRAAEERVAATTSSAARMARKHVIAVQGMLRRLKRWLGLIVDITTLKRLRLLRQARQVCLP